MSAVIREPRPTKSNTPRTNEKIVGAVENAKIANNGQSARPPPITNHISHFETLPRLQDRNLRFAFGQPGKLFRVTK